MTKLKHHAVMIRQLVEHHADNIHGAKDDEANKLGIHVSTPKPLAKPVSPDKANVSTLIHHK